MTNPGALPRDAQVGRARQTRILYRSSNGDCWLLDKDDAGHVAVEHRPNVSSGGRTEIIGLSAFLARGASPERDELIRLIGTLVDSAHAGPETS